MSLLDAIEYEIMSTWWVGWVRWKPLQRIVGRHFARLSIRKFEKYMDFKAKQTAFSGLGRAE